MCLCLISKKSDVDLKYWALRIIRKIRRRIATVRKKDLLLEPKVRVNKVKLGSEYGGYWVCPDNLNSDSIIYSIGIGHDVTFDLDIIRRYGCKVFAFDPTPRSIEWVNNQIMPREFTFSPIGLAPYDGIARFYVPSNSENISHSMSRHANVQDNSIEVEVRTFQFLMNMNNHENIDILKMDIEASEYEVIDSFTHSNLPVQQICIEFHHRFSKFSVVDTLKAIEKLEQLGFILYHQENDSYHFIRMSSATIQ